MLTCSWTECQSCLVCRASFVDEISFQLLLLSPWHRRAGGWVGFVKELPRLGLTKMESAVLLWSQRYFYTFLSFYFCQIYHTNPLPCGNSCTHVLYLFEGQFFFFCLRDELKKTDSLISTLTPNHQGESNWVLILSRGTWSVHSDLKCISNNYLNGVVLATKLAVLQWVIMNELLTLTLSLKRYLS